VGPLGTLIQLGADHGEGQLAPLQGEHEGLQVLVDAGGVELHVHRLQQAALGAFPGGGPVLGGDQPDPVLAAQLEQLLAELPVQFADPLHRHVLHELVQGLPVGLDLVGLGLDRAQFPDLPVEGGRGVLQGLLGLELLLGGVGQQEDGGGDPGQGQDGAYDQTRDLCMMYQKAVDSVHTSLK